MKLQIDSWTFVPAATIEKEDGTRHDVKEFLLSNYISVGQYKQFADQENYVTVGEARSEFETYRHN